MTAPSERSKALALHRGKGFLRGLSKELATSASDIDGFSDGTLAALVGVGFTFGTSFLCLSLFAPDLDLFVISAIATSLGTGAGALSTLFRRWLRRRRQLGDEKRVNTRRAYQLLEEAKTHGIADSKVLQGVQDVVVQELEELGCLSKGERRTELNPALEEPAD